MDLDLASFASIRACVDRLKVAFKKIDILILNAGVAVPLTLGMKTDEGHELNFGVNHLGHFLFTNLLIDLLKKGAPSR